MISAEITKEIEISYRKGKIGREKKKKEREQVDMSGPPDFRDGNIWIRDQIALSFIRDDGQGTVATTSAVPDF